MDSERNSESCQKVEWSNHSWWPCRCICTQKTIRNGPDEIRNEIRDDMRHGKNPTIDCFYDKRASHRLWKYDRLFVNFHYLLQYSVYETGLQSMIRYLTKTNHANFKIAMHKGKQRKNAYSYRTKVPLYRLQCWRKRQLSKASVRQKSSEIKV